MLRALTGRPADSSVTGPGGRVCAGAGAGAICRALPPEGAQRGGTCVAVSLLPVIRGRLAKRAPDALLRLTINFAGRRGVTDSGDGWPTVRGPTVRTGRPAVTPGRAADASSDAPEPSVSLTKPPRLQDSAAAAAGCTTTAGRREIDDGTFRELLTTDTRVSSTGFPRDNITLTAL